MEILQKENIEQNEKDQQQGESPFGDLKKGQLVMLDKQDNKIQATPPQALDTQNLKYGLDNISQKMEPRFKGWVKAVDGITRIMVDKSFRTGDDPIDNARQPLRFAMWVSFIVFGVFGIWGALAPLDSAAVAKG